MKSNLSTPSDAYKLMSDIMIGTYATDDLMSFFQETVNTQPSVEVMAAFLQAIKDSSQVGINANAFDKPIIDIVGTGGDGLNTANISTMATLVAASTGLVKAAKYGNRSATSLCGSMDVLEALGVKIELSSAEVNASIHTYGFAPIFARSFLKGAKYLAEARMNFGKPTIFNTLFPLARPMTGTVHCLFGVAQIEQLSLYKGILQQDPSNHCLLIHGNDGSDEITIADSGTTSYCLVKGGQSDNGFFDCQSIGITPVKIEDLQITSKDDAVAVFHNVIDPSCNDDRITSVRQAVLVNAAFGLCLGLEKIGDLSSIQDYYRIAANALYSTKTQQLLEQLKGEK